jgi:Ankyrin repeats (many copies)
MKEILDYLTRYFHHHSSYAITVRVLQCLIYIEQNIDTIAAKVGSKDIIRHPTNHLAFHLAGYDNAADAKRELLDLVNEVRKCFSDMIAIADESIRYQVITFFLNNINDSQTGCMEARLRPALMSYALYLNVGCHDLHSHMEAFANQYPELKVVDVLTFFGMPIQHHILVKDTQGDLLPLTWPLVKNYLSRILAWDSIEDDWRDALQTLAPPKISVTRRWYWHCFNYESDASLYLTYIKSLLIEQYPDLIQAEVKYDAARRVYSFRLTEGQFIAFKIAVSAMMGKDKEKINHPLQNDNNQIVQVTAVKESYIEQLTQLLNNEIESIDPNTEKLNVTDVDARCHQLRTLIRHKAARHVQHGDFIVKTLRVDDKCFYRRFIESITAPYEKHVLRRGLKKQYTVTGRGVFRRMLNNDRARTDVKVAQYKPEERIGFSKTQSATLGMPTYYPRLFGFTKRREKLVGMMTDVGNVLFSLRLYLYDGGTVDRPYDFDDYEEAKKYYQDKAGVILFSDDELDKFKDCILQNPESYNEAMVRMRWGSNKTSRIIIGSDSLLARLWAREDARILKHYFVTNRLMTADEDITIIYYLPDNPDLHLKEYSMAEFYLDSIVAYQLYSDPQARLQYYANHDYEILLAVPREQLIEVFRKNLNGINLILKIIADGYAHLVVSLLEKAGDDYRNELTKALKQALHKQENLSLVWSVLYQCDKSKNHELFALIRDMAPLKRSLAYMKKANANELHTYFYQSAEHNYTNYLLLFMLYVHKNHYNKALTFLASAEQKMIALAMRSAIDADDAGLVLGLIRCKNIDIKSTAFQFMLGERDRYYTECPLLFYAAKYGKVKVVNALLALGVIDVNMVDKEGNGALLLAALAGHIEVVKVLLAHPEIKVERLLATACYGGGIEVVKVCCEQPSLNLNNKDLNAVINFVEGKNELKILSILFSHPDFNESHVEIAFRKPDLQDDTRLFLLNHNKFNADLGHSSTVTALLKMAKNSKYADAVLEYLYHKYLPQYRAALKQREGDYKHFYGRWFGVDKDKKLHAVDALLACEDLTRHQEALSDGALGNVMKILNQCQATLGYLRRLRHSNLYAPG